MGTMKQLFQLNSEIHRTGTNHVLYFKINEFYSWITNFLNCFGVALRGLLAMLLTFGACNHHFTRFKNQSSGPSGFFHSHYYRRKSFGIKFSITTSKSDFFQFKITLQIGGAYQILDFRWLVNRFLLYSLN